MLTRRYTQLVKLTLGGSSIQNNRSELFRICAYRWAVYSLRAECIVYLLAQEASHLMSNLDFKKAVEEIGQVAEWARVLNCRRIDTM